MPEVTRRERMLIEVIKELSAAAKAVPQQKLLGRQPKFPRLVDAVNAADALIEQIQP